MLGFIVLFFIIVIIALLAKLNKPQLKGKIGEMLISCLLSKLDPNKYYVLHDVLIRHDKGTSQIDHIVVSNYGIFVIETKNYKGWIYGDDRSKYWTQVLYKRKEKFVNPLHQNYGHMKAIEQIFTNKEDLSFIPIVVFLDQATLKVETTAHVIYSTHLLKTIKKYKEPIYSDFMKKKIYKTIQNHNINSKSATKEHIQTIQTNLENEQQLINRNICPKCNNELTPKEGKYGRFKACTRFPKCRFTVKI